MRGGESRQSRRRRARTREGQNFVAGTFRLANALACGSLQVSTRLPGQCSRCGDCRRWLLPGGAGLLAHTVN